MSNLSLSSVARAKERLDFLEHVAGALTKALKPFVKRCSKVEGRYVRVRIEADHSGLDDIVLRVDGDGIHDMPEVSSIPF
jgi:hypothetical protein